MWIIRKIDTNPLLNRLLSGTSTTLAVHRGLPMLGGTVLVVLSCLVFGVVLPVIVKSTDADNIWLLLCLPIFLLHLGIFIAFTGFMMAAPLGRGFRE